MACSSPLQNGYSTEYGIGSEVYRSGVAAEAALTDVKSRQAPGTTLEKGIRLLRAPMPNMPEEAIDAGLSDLVTVSILFNEQGEVESVAPKTYRYAVLLEAVLAVVSGWKIEPPVENGRPVKTTAWQSFRFEVQ